MRRAPIRARTFLLATLLALLLLPTLAGGAAWWIERAHQQANVHRRLDTAVAYLTSHGVRMQQPAVVRGFARTIDRLDLLAQLTFMTKPHPEKNLLYASPALNPVFQKRQAARLARKGAPAPLTANGLSPGPSWIPDHTQLIPVGTRKARSFLAVDLYHRRTSRTTRALAALLTGTIVLLAGLAVAVWLAGRWIAAPLAGLSAEVDKVAGGDLDIAVPRSRIGEIANIAQAVEGMTSALGETAQRRAAADEARRFLVTGIAHDLRTPLFALRGHLQAMGARLGDPGVHLERAEARADALERMIGNLFAYTRDDYAQPALKLETVAVADLLHEVTAGLEHTARLENNSFDLHGDPALAVVGDRDRLRRALTNILDNALRHSPAGGAIHVGWSVSGDAIGITVEDEGAGIEPALLPHIFEPGIRGASAAGNHDGGAGLGLTIAKRFLEQQHGTLTAHNRASGGAQLVLTLARAPTAAHAVLQLPEEPSPRLSAPPPPHA